MNKSASAETIAATRHALLYPSAKSIEEAAVSSFTDGYNAALDDIAEVIEEYAPIASPTIIAAAIRKAALTR